METLAPPVVAVVVAHDPGPWFAETLASIASQDYAELSVLVLDTGLSGDLAARVAKVLPDAYVRRFGSNRGFGATVNEVRTMVNGASYYLLCHDDVALDPDVVHPVSYTHLDVYKRQPSGWLGSSSGSARSSPRRAPTCTTAPTTRCPGGHRCPRW